jgi:hypothetical protein
MVQKQKMWNRDLFNARMRERIARIKKVWKRVQFSLQTHARAFFALSYGLNRDEVNRFRWSLMVHTLGLIFVWWALCMLPLVISKP